METPGGTMAVMKMDGINYRHYLITQHAIERWQQRTALSLDYMFVSLDRVVMADAKQARDHRIQQQIRKSESNGGYCMFDPETNIYFFMAVGNKRHTICTVMTRETMCYAH
ncbi:hypothetical protein H8U31_001282 [Salmonella enterica]|nr:hypothetical protein [Salmonella enterica]EFO7976573.1 hypothetical protein [Salmonella enterica]EGC0267532.1 hypothetical protein [Salmonella enterica]